MFLNVDIYCTENVIRLPVIDRIRVVLRLYQDCGINSNLLTLNYKLRMTTIKRIFYFFCVFPLLSGHLAFCLLFKTNLEPSTLILVGPL